MHSPSHRGSWWSILAGMAFLAFVAVPSPSSGRTGQAEDYAWIPGKLADYLNPNFQETVRSISPDYDELHRDQQIEAYLRAYRQLNHGQTPDLSPYDAFLADGEKTGPNLPPPLPAPDESAPVPPPDGAGVNRPGGDGDSDYTFIPGYGYHYDPPGFAGAVPASGGSAGAVPQPLEVGVNNVPYSTNPFVAKPREVDQLHVTQEHVNQADVTQLHAGPN